MRGALIELEADTALPPDLERGFSLVHAIEGPDVDRVLDIPDVKMVDRRCYRRLVPYEVARAP